MAAAWTQLSGLGFVICFSFIRHVDRIPHGGDEPPTIVLSAAWHDGQAVLDAGCGFGGTLADRGEPQGHDAHRRQHRSSPARARAARAGRGLRRGRRLRPAVPTHPSIALAVECIFHFLSRQRFLGSARARSGGRVALSGQPPRPSEPESALGRFVRRRIESLNGGGAGLGERRLRGDGARGGPLRRGDRDITAQVQPTTRFCSTIAQGLPGGRESRMKWPTRFACLARRRVRYRIIGWSFATGLTLNR